eukprot:TRINITY_DN1660_c1_g1_i1.p1 TRINITY_DN1660_c1_g1~~TRINITY_DN1660_c1_g1_i1.p1  ORF type:complete len:621 (+),score=185.61 TRINITY_DN1660_c1_g1_i1:63-1865(+)
MPGLALHVVRIALAVGGAPPPPPPPPPPSPPPPPASSCGAHSGSAACTADSQGCVIVASQCLSDCTARGSAPCAAAADCVWSSSLNACARNCSAAATSSEPVCNGASECSWHSAACRVNCEGVQGGRSACLTHSLCGWNPSGNGFCISSCSHQTRDHCLAAPHCAWTSVSCIVDCGTYTDATTCGGQAACGWDGSRCVPSGGSGGRSTWWVWLLLVLVVLALAAAGVVIHLWQKKKTKEAELAEEKGDVPSDEELTVVIKRESKDNPVGWTLSSAAHVEEVEEGSAAAMAGVEEGHWVSSVNGVAVSTDEEVTAVVRNAPGADLRVTLSVPYEMSVRHQSLAGAEPIDPDVKRGCREVPPESPQRPSTAASEERSEGPQYVADDRPDGRVAEVVVGGATLPEEVNFTAVEEIVVGYDEGDDGSQSDHRAASQAASPQQHPAQSSSLPLQQSHPEGDVVSRYVSGGVEHVVHGSPQVPYAQQQQQRSVDDGLRTLMQLQMMSLMAPQQHTIDVVRTPEVRQHTSPRVWTSGSARGTSDAWKLAADVRLCRLQLAAATQPASDAGDLQQRVAALERATQDGYMGADDDIDSRSSNSSGRVPY